MKHFFIIKRFSSEAVYNATPREKRNPEILVPEQSKSDGEATYVTPAVYSSGTVAEKECDGDAFIETTEITEAEFHSSVKDPTAEETTLHECNNEEGIPCVITKL